MIVVSVVLQRQCSCQLSSKSYIFTFREVLWEGKRAGLNKAQGGKKPFCHELPESKNDMNT